MRFKSIGQFLELFPASTTRAFRGALLLSVLLSMLDFVSLVLLLPVFAVLSSGSPASSSSANIGGLFAGADARLLVVVAMVVMICRSVGGFVMRYWWSRKVAEAEVSLSSRLLAAYAFAPYAFHLRRNSADLLSRAVAHVNQATGAGLNGFVLLATDLTTVAALSAALFLASPLAGIVVFSYLTVVGFAFAFISRRFIVMQTRRFGEEVGQVYRRTSTILRGIRELTVAGGRKTVLTSIDQSRAKMVRAQRNMTVLTEVPRMTLEVALYSAILIALLLVLGSEHPESSLPVVALYVVAGLRVMPSIARGLGSLTQARSGIEIGTQIAEELREVSVASTDPVQRASGLPRQGTLVLENIGFSYDDGPPVLADVDLVVTFGSYLAIVGPSGAGKSTLLGVLLGLLEPSSGTVTYGGADIGLADPEWLRHVSYVPQEAFVLDDTVLSNIALGDVERDAERAWRALERAALAPMVRGMERGLDTPLGENGSRLSVGQRQRLGIARALYREPAVLVLDEPTASLDQDSEAQVMATIDTLRRSLTIVIVTHRLETIASADTIARLDNGMLEVVNSVADAVVGARDAGP